MASTLRQRFAVNEAELPMKPFKIRLHQRPWLLVRVFVLVQLLTLVAMGFYYGLTQTGIAMGWFVHVLQQSHFAPFEAFARRAMRQAAVEHLPLSNKVLWHALVPDDYRRHGWRKLTEALAAGVGGLALNLNVYSPRRLRRLGSPPNWFDRLEFRLRVPNFKDDDYRDSRGLPQLSGPQAAAAFFVWQWVYAAPVVYVLLWLTSAFHQGPAAYIIIGLIASPFAKRPMGPVLYEFDKWRAQQWVARQRTMRWYHRLAFTPQFREMIRRTQEQGSQVARQALRERSGWLIAAGLLIALALLACLATGVWIRFWLI